MSFAVAAPVAEAAEVAGGAAARGAGASAAKSAGKATVKRARVRPAPERARELARSGVSRDDAARTLSAEYGSTLAESKGLLGDQAPDVPPAAPPKDTPAPAPSSSGPSFNPPKSVSSAASAGGGAILATLVYVLFLTYLRGGTEGLKAWGRAKFLNQTTTSTRAPATAGSSGASGMNGTGATGQGAGAGGVGAW